MAQTKPTKLVECAFGDMAKITRCLGYCHKHKCYLTKTNLDNMNCLQKKCKHLKKIESHPYWVELIRKEEDKKRRKEYRRKLYEKGLDRKL